MEPNYELPEPPSITEDIGAESAGTSTQAVAPILKDDPQDEIDLGRRESEVNQAWGCKLWHWKEKQLAPFAIDREGDWLRHRELLNEVPLAEIIGKPQLMLNDALRVLWFLAHEPVEWLNIPSMRYDGEEAGWHRLSAFDRAYLLELKIREWSAANVRREEGALAVQVFYEIYSSAHETRAVAKPGERHDSARSKN